MKRITPDVVTILNSAPIYLSGIFARSFVLKNRDQEIRVTIMCSRYVWLPF